MFSRYSGGVRCLALVLTVLPLVGCAGSSANIELHVASETAADTHGYFPVRPYGRRAAGPVKQRAAALCRAAYGCLLAIVAAAAVTLLVLRCASVFGVRRRHDRHGRFLAEGGNKDVLGACGATLGGADVKAPSEASEVETATPVEERVSKVLGAISKLTRKVEKRYLAVPSLLGLMMVVRLQSVAVLELGALAGLVEGALEQKRRGVAEHVLKLSHNALKVEPTARHLRPRRFRIKEQVSILKTIKRNEFPAPPLEPEERQAKLEDLVQVQEKFLEMAKTLLEELASFQARDTPVDKVPPFGPHKVLGKLFYKRKMHLLKNPSFRDKLLWFQENSEGNALLTPQEDVGEGPAPSTSEQLQELQAIMEAEHPEAQEPHTVSMSHPGPPDVSVSPQQSADGSATSAQPHRGPVHQAALSLQSVSIGQPPGSGLLPLPAPVRPFQGFPPRSSVSRHPRLPLLPQVFLPSGPHSMPARAAPRQPLPATGTLLLPMVLPGPHTVPATTPRQALPPPAPSPSIAFVRTSPPPFVSMHQGPPGLYQGVPPFGPHAGSSAIPYQPLPARGPTSMQGSPSPLLSAPEQPLPHPRAPRVRYSPHHARHPHPRPSQGALPSGPHASGASASASSGLSPGARPFFPLTESSAPGAHRTQHPFYGDPHGMPQASGYSADSGAPGEASQEPQPDSKDQT